MKYTFSIIITLTMSFNGISQQSKDCIILSQQFLYAVKTNDEVEIAKQNLSEITTEKLITQLNSDEKKVTFWLNVYNGYIQYLLKKNTDQYKKRSQFFNSKQINVSGEMINFQLIENGILRHSKSLISMGYYSKLFPSKKEKLLRVNKPDYRIHFALNCGAKSCPSIKFYTLENIDSQLNMATKAFLENECKKDTISKTVYVPKIFSWFRGDFGGKKGTRKILIKYGILTPEQDYSIKYSKYDWTLALNSYQDN